MKTFFNLIIALFAFAFFTGAVAEATGADVQTVMEITAAVSLASVGIRLAAKTTKQEVRGLAFAISTEVWEEFIASNLYKMYPWLTRAKDRSSKVISNAVVHIPQAGSFVSVKRNRDVFPVPLVKRSDSDLTYAIDELSSNAIRISNAEMVELSYSKIEDAIGDLTNQLGMDCARNALYRWLGKNPSGSNLSQSNIIRTTGADMVAHVNATATGNRKKPLAADIASGKVIQVAGTKRESFNGIAVMDETMYNALKSDSTITNKDTMDQYGAVWQDGDLKKLHGYEIVRTDVMPTFTNSTPAAKDPFDASVTEATSDNAAIGLIDLSMVHIAKGQIEFFETLRDAQNQGDIYSALVRIGASRERVDDAGVVAVVQAAGT